MVLNQKQGSEKCNKGPTMRRPGGLQEDIWTHFGVILASRSTEKPEKERSRKTCFSGEGQYVCPGAMSPSKSAGMSGHAGPMEPFGEEN